MQTSIFSTNSAGTIGYPYEEEREEEEKDRKEERKREEEIEEEKLKVEEKIGALCHIQKK
jgi:hypothetical protein